MITAKQLIAKLGREFAPGEIPSIHIMDLAYDLALEEFGTDDDPAFTDRREEIEEDLFDMADADYEDNERSTA